MNKKIAKCIPIVSKLILLGSGGFLLFECIFLNINQTFLHMSLEDELREKARATARNDFKNMQIRYYEIKEKDGEIKKITSDAPHRFEGNIPVHYYYYFTTELDNWLSVSEKDLAHFYIQEYNALMKILTSEPDLKKRK